MVNRLVVALPQAEYSALLQMAREELRNPSDQLRVILREVLEQRRTQLLAEQSREAGGEDESQK